MWQSEYKYLPFDNGEYWLCILLSLAILSAAGLIIWLIYGGIYDYFDNRSATIETLTGELIDRRYIGEQTSSGTGTAILPNTNGGVGLGLVSTSSHSDEEFLFFIKADKVYKVEVDMQQFYAYKIGDKIRFELKRGGLSKEELDTAVIGQ